eukprot:COSAG01_NODE_27495_length_684_cov_1.148718_1_plen_45_part_00
MAVMGCMLLLLFYINTDLTFAEQLTYFLWLVRADTSWVGPRILA